jgi:Family of unknown function (DUF5681)
MTFRKGQSGNPGGKPKELRAIQLLARECGEAAIKTLNDVMMSDKSPPAAKTTAAIALLDRGYGKPPAFVTNAADQFRDVVEMSDEELLEIVANGNPTVRKTQLPPDQ